MNSPYAVYVKTKGWTAAFCRIDVGAADIKLSQVASPLTSATLLPALIPAHIYTIIDAHTYYDNSRR